VCVCVRTAVSSKYATCQARSCVSRFGVSREKEPAKGDRDDGLMVTEKCHQRPTASVYSQKNEWKKCQPV